MGESVFGAHEHQKGSPPGLEALPLTQRLQGPEAPDGEEQR